MLVQQFDVREGEVTAFAFTFALPLAVHIYFGHLHRVAHLGRERRDSQRAAWRLLQPQDVGYSGAGRVGGGVAALVSMNLSKQGLTANSKVQVGEGGDRKFKVVRAGSTSTITFKKKPFHALMCNWRHLHGCKSLGDASFLPG